MTGAVQTASRRLTPVAISSAPSECLTLLSNTSWRCAENAPRIGVEVDAPRRTRPGVALPRRRRAGDRSRVLARLLQLLADEEDLHAELGGPCLPRSIGGVRRTAGTSSER